MSRRFSSLTWVSLASRVLACHTTDRFRDEWTTRSKEAERRGNGRSVTCSSDKDDVTLQPAAGPSSLSVSAIVSGPLPGDDGERPTLRSKQTGEQPARRAESMSSIDDLRGVCLSA